MCRAVETAGRRGQPLRLRGDIVVGRVAEGEGGLHQKDDGCGIKADGKDEV